MIEGDVRHIMASQASLVAGMYVRVHIEEDREDAEFRDYRIGHLEEINPVAQTALIRLLVQASGEPSYLVQRGGNNPLVQATSALPW